MNKIINLVIMLLLIMLVACTNSTSVENSANEQASSVREEQDLNTEEGISENKNEINDEIEDKKVNEGTQTEKYEPELKSQYEINENWYIVPKNDEANDQIVLLTIDDAPDQHGLDMAKTLKELDAQAIFFVNGHFLESKEKQEELKEIHDMGFIIGNHTYNHQYLPDLSEEEQKKEIVELNDLVEDIIGERPQFFRAPNGGNTDFTKEVAKEENMTLMNWSYGYDWNEEYQTKDAITDIMLNAPELNNGANLLMHDREWTAEALQDIVKGLREQGYEIVDPHLIETK